MLMWSKKASTNKGDYRSEGLDDKQLLLHGIRTVASIEAAAPSSSSSSSLHSHPLPQQNSRQQPPHAGSNPPSSQTATGMPRTLTPTPSSAASETIDTVTSSSISKLLHPSYYSTAYQHQHHNYDGDQQQQPLQSSPTPFRPMPPREFSLGSNLRRLYPTMPLPTTFPADTTSAADATSIINISSGGGAGGGGGRAASALAHSHRDNTGASSQNIITGKHNVMGGISEAKDENDISRKSNTHSLQSSGSELSVSLSMLDDGGLRRSQRTSLHEGETTRIARGPPLPPKSKSTATATMARRKSDDLPAKSSMSLLVESSMSLSVYEQDIEDEAAKRESVVLSGSGSRQERRSVDKVVHPSLLPPPIPSPLLDASSKHNASETSLLSSTGSLANRKRGRMMVTNNEINHQSGEHQPLAVNTMFDAMRGGPSDENGDYAIPESIVRDISTPMSMSTISYHGGNDDNPAGPIPTATARFGRLLQECRKLTETIGDDTILSNSTGIDSTSNSKDKLDSSIDRDGGSSSVANRSSSYSALHNRSTVASVASTPVSDTLKFRHIPGGSSSGLPSNASKQSNPSENNPKLESATSRKPFLQRGSVNQSILSDLSLGVDAMYGELDGDVNKSNTADDMMASSNSKLMLNNVVESIEGGTRLSTMGNAEKSQSSKQKKEEMKITTNKKMTHGREFRPREEDAQSNITKDRGSGGGGDYSWLTYTTKGDNAETPKSEIVTAKTSPLQDDEIRIPKNTRRSVTNSSYSTDLSEDSGGLLVGFGHRRKVAGSEASSISSSDSSNSFSSYSGNSTSDSTGSSDSSSSDESSSESESDESSGMPAITRHGLRIPSSTDSQSDMVSALSFGGASTLMALQALKSSISSPGSPGMVDGEGNIPRRSPPGVKKLVQTEQNVRADSDTAVLEPQNSNNDLQIPPSHGVTRSTSIDRYSGLEKLDEISESNASFPDDVLAVGLLNNSNQNQFTNPITENFSSTTSASDHGGVKDSTSLPQKSSQLSSLPLHYDASTASTAKPSSYLFSDGEERNSLTNEATKDSSLNCQRPHFSEFPQQQGYSANRVLSSPFTISSTHHIEDSLSSEIVSKAAVRKSHASCDPSSGMSSTSRSSSSSNGQMQHIVSTEGGRQDAGIKTIESCRGVSPATKMKVDGELAYSDSFVRAEVRNLTVEMHENTYNEGNQTQVKFQGSGESPLENIKSNMNDDLSSSISSVASRARDSFTRGMPAVASQSKSSNKVNDSSGISHQELYEDFPDLIKGLDELKESSEILGLSSKSDIVVENVLSSELDCNSAESANDRVTTDHRKKKLSFDNRSIKSGDGDNFIGDELYEDFPHMLNDGEMIVFQRNKSSQALQTSEETDWKKPWNTSSKKLLSDAPSSQGSDVETKFRSGSIASIEMQSLEDQRSSDGSMVLFESKRALENMGVYAAVPEIGNPSCELETPTINRETQHRKRVSRSSNASSSITEWDFSGKEPATLPNGSIAKPSSIKSGLSYHVEEFDPIEYSQSDISPSNLKKEEQLENENVNPMGGSSSVRMVASDEFIGDETTSFCLSEKSTKSDVQSPQSLQDRFHMATVSHSPFDSDEDKVGREGEEEEEEEMSQGSKQDDESSQSAIGLSCSKSLDGAFNESGNSMSLHMTTQGELIVDEDSSDVGDESDEEIQTVQSSKRHSQRRFKCQKSTLSLLVALFVLVLVAAIVAGVVAYQLKKSSDNSSTSVNKPTEVTNPSPTALPTQPPVNAIPNWIQVGNDLVGELSGDETGFSISVSEDGSRAVVGARRNERGGFRNRGAARIFEFDIDSNSFVPMWDVVGEAAGDQCGYSVSMARNGTRIAVGCIGSDKNGKNAGQVLIFDEDKLLNSWKLVHEMVGEGEYSLFGTSVSFSQDGSKIIVGAPYHSEGTDVSKSGRSYVYAETNDAKWVQLGGSMNGKSSNELFGWSVSFSPIAPFVAIGAPLLEGSSDSGYVKVYAFQENDWKEYGEQMMLGVAGDRFGFSVSLAGDYTYQRVAIGAPGMSMNGEGSGLVSVYESDGNGGWHRSGNDLLGGSLGENLGYAVSITSDGNRMTVGVPNKKVNGMTVGQVQVVDISYDGLTSAGDISGREGERFGASVSVSGDGRLIYGGSPKTNLARVFGEMY